MLLRIPPDDRERFMPLLLLADESQEQVRSYMRRGELYAFHEDDASLAAGIVLAIAEPEPRCVELKAVAVRPDSEGRGVGRTMLRAVLEDLRARGVKRVVVGTANAGIGQLAY